MTTIDGNTYPVKDQLKALGARWNARIMKWEVPDDKVEAAALLLFPASPPHVAVYQATGRAPRKQATHRPGRAPRTCKECGQRINYGVYCGKCEYR